MWGDLDSVKLLVERGAHVYQPTKEGLYPIDFAAWKGHKDCAEFLIQKTIEEVIEYSPYQVRDLIKVNCM